MKIIAMLCKNWKIDFSKIANIWFVKFWVFKITYLAQFSTDLSNPDLKF